MEEQIERLTAKAWRQYQTLPPERRLIIGVSGMPGSGQTRSQLTPWKLRSCGTDPAAATGKSTLAATIVDRLNGINQNAGHSKLAKVAAVVPMDGFHYTRKQLDAMPDPVTAHARRGAAFTFDAPAYLELIERLRKPLVDNSMVCLAPSFDHGVGDPVEHAIRIEQSTRIIVCEGNYLSLGTGAAEWKRAAELMDELWFVEVDETVARQRLIVRHMISGKPEQVAIARADQNDLPNGRNIVEGRLPVHEVIRSVDDRDWQPACPYMSST